jgi:hypothetical protein
MKKHVPFVFLNKGTPSITFLKLLPSPLMWNIKIKTFVNPLEVSNYTSFEQSFDIKFKMKKFSSMNPMLS